MSDRPYAEGFSAAALGVGFVVLGLALLAVQFLNVDLGRYGWPLFVIVPGFVLLVSGFIGRGTLGLIVGGTVVTSVGLVLLYQNTTGHWESWAYAWALVGPGAGGLGMALAGLRSGDSAAVRTGTWQALGGLGVFVAGLIFFEQIIGISGRRVALPDWSLAALVIVIGVVLVARAALTREDAPD
jgi:hypothetical protein